MPSNRTLLSSIRLSDIVRATALMTISGITSASLAADAASAATAGTQNATEGAPKAPDAQPAPTRDATPAKADDRTVSVSGPAATPSTPPSQLRGVRSGRRTIDDEPIRLTFKNEGIEATIPFIYAWTGKYVYYKQSDLGSRKITLVGDRDIPKSQALDYLFQALKMEGLAVTETEDMIYIGQQTELIKTQPGVVLGADDDVMSIADNGLFVTKIFRLKQASSVDVLDRIRDLIPEDYAKVSADGDSNQIILSGDIGLAKKVQTLLDMLDTPSWNDYQTETFRLKYQDAGTISEIIQELFSDVGASRGGSTSRQPRQQRGGQPVPQGVPGGQAGGGSSELIVTTLPSMNSLTVRATPTVLAEIRRLVASAWDLEPNAAGSIFRTYDLKYADPVKVRDLLTTVLGGGSSSSRSNVSNRAFAGGRALQGGGNIGGDGNPQAAVANIFSIESYPDSNRLVVISKTPDNYEWLDKWIAELDQPFTSGLPVNVPLKHASAVELSEILNTLLASSGSEGGGLRLPEEGLSGLDADFGGNGGDESAGSSTFSSGAQGQQSNLRFPWQGARAGQGAGGSPQEVSGLIGRSRVVPNPTQNSVLVMAPSEVEKKVVEIIQELDKPGRQVMITAVLAEVKVGDGFSWGARIGREGDLASPLNGTENSVLGTIGLELTKGGEGDDASNFASPWFDSSSLSISTTDDMAFLLQALSTDNSVRILQQPRVFTSDNKEAKFVAGSDVSFQTGSTTGTGGTTASFNQQFVGVGINVRPRITQDNNVAMEIELLLSDLTNEQSFGNRIVNRRQTNTNVTVKNGQTIVISGIRREGEQKIDRRLPFLGDIPILGAAFSSTERQKEVVELVVFLVPLVVENPDANDANFNAEELHRLKMLSEPLEKGSEKLLKESKFFEEIKQTPAEKGGKAAEPAPEPTKAG